MWWWWWGTPEPNAASSPPLFKYRARLFSWDRSLPRACTLVTSWVQEGSVEGLPCHKRREQPDSLYGRNSTRVRPVPSSAVGQEVDEAAGETPGPKRGARAAAGLRSLPGPFLPSRTLPLQHKPRSTMRTPDALFIVDILSPLDTLFYYLCSIKIYPLLDATPTVSVVCSHIYIYMILGLPQLTGYYR